MDISFVLPFVFFLPLRVLELLACVRYNFSIIIVSDPCFFLAQAPCLQVVALVGRAEVQKCHQRLVETALDETETLVSSTFQALSL